MIHWWLYITVKASTPSPNKIKSARVHNNIKLKDEYQYTPLQNKMPLDGKVCLVSRAGRRRARQGMRWLHPGEQTWTSVCPFSHREAYGTQCKTKGTDIPAKHGYMAKWCIKMHYDALTFYGKKLKYNLKQVLLHRYTIESKLWCVLQRTSKSFWNIVHVTGRSMRLSSWANTNKKLENNRGVRLDILRSNCQKISPINNDDAIDCTARTTVRAWTWACKSLKLKDTAGMRLCLCDLFLPSREWLRNWLPYLS